MSDKANEEPPPGQQPAGPRRDVEPHRGGLLFTLALGGFALSLPAGCLGFLSVAVALEKKRPAAHVDFVFTEITLLLGLVALALGLTGARLARRDLAEMAAGRVDQAGEWETEMAHSCGRLGAVIAALSCLLAASSAFFLF